MTAQLSEEIIMRLALAKQITPRGINHGVIVGFRAGYSTATYKTAEPPFVYMFSSNPLRMDAEASDLAMMFDVKEIDTYVLALEMQSRMAPTPEEAGFRAIKSDEDPDCIVFIVNMGKGDVRCFILHDDRPNHVSEIELPPSPIIGKYADLAPGNAYRERAAERRKKLSPEEIEAWMQFFAFEETESTKATDLMDRMANSPTTTIRVN